MEYRNENIDQKGLLFGKWCSMPGVWTFTNRWQNFMYLLVGEEKALLIDTGYGEGNFRQIVESITSKPVMVVNTHGHFDHTGGNGWWDAAWMAEGAVAGARFPFNEEQQSWFDAKPHRDYAIHILKEGDIIDLGGKTVEVLSIPAHQEGSIALLDKTDRLLFTGDELEAGQVLLFVRDHNLSLEQVVSAHKANMEKLTARRSEYDFICPAHNGTMLQPDLYLKDFIALDQSVLDNTADVQPDTAGFGFAPYPVGDDLFARMGPKERAQYGQASIVYLKEEVPHER